MWQNSTLRSSINSMLHFLISEMLFHQIDILQGTLSFIISRQQYKGDWNSPCDSSSVLHTALQLEGLTKNPTVNITVFNTIINATAKD